MEIHRSIVVEGLDVAMQRRLGIEHVRRLGAEAKERAGKGSNEMTFDLCGWTATIPLVPNPIAASKPGGRDLSGTAINVNRDTQSSRN